MVTQREAYYTLVPYFGNQTQFNNTVQGQSMNQMFTYAHKMWPKMTVL